MPTWTYTVDSDSIQPAGSSASVQVVILKDGEPYDSYRFDLEGNLAGLDGEGLKDLILPKVRPIVTVLAATFAQQESAALAVSRAQSAAEDISGEEVAVEA